MLSICAVGAASACLVACGSPASLSSDQAEELNAARDQAAEATAQVAEMEESFEELEARFEKLERTDEGAAARAGRQRERLEGISGRLRERVEDLRAAIADAEAAAATASSNVSSALSEARSAAQSLSVLRARYDEHLRRFHGGG
jgi:ABC-type transporter Mla subunit MlaD